MAKGYQSKSDYSARKAQNKGVKHGTRRVGRGGRTVRQWNAKTARWDVVGPKGRSGIHGQVASGAKMAGSGSDGVNAATSVGTARVSSAGTWTESYKRSSRGQVTVPTFFANVDQKRREQRRIAASKKSGSILNKRLKDYR